MSATSIMTTQSAPPIISKLDALKLRRYSIMATGDLSEKFWVPQKQRVSLPNTSTIQERISSGKKTFNFCLPDSLCIYTFL